MFPHISVVCVDLDGNVRKCASSIVVTPLTVTVVPVLLEAAVRDSRSFASLTEKALSLIHILNQSTTLPPSHRIFCVAHRTEPTVGSGKDGQK